MILVDTHVWVWGLKDLGLLSDPARAAIELEPRLGMSPITCWEIAMLVGKRRVELDRPVERWIRTMLDAPGTELVRITSAAALTAGRTDLALPGDPAGRLIAATAIARQIPLITKDTRLLQSDDLKTIW